MAKAAKAAKKPPIHMIDRESDELANLALTVEHRLPQVCEMLLDEIERAQIHPAGKIPPDVVTMGASVEFVDENSGASRTVQLVYPNEADIAQGRISILTPIGAGLIGLRAGQSIAWPDREGMVRQLRIIAVKQTRDS